jgi:TPR repeat protein
LRKVCISCGIAYFLRLAHFAGLGTKKNAEAAMRYYASAIANGDLDARYQLGGMHFEREEYEQAAEQFEHVQQQRVEALGKLGMSESLFFFVLFFFVFFF